MSRLYFWLFNFIHNLTILTKDSHNEAPTAAVANAPAESWATALAAAEKVFFVAHYSLAS
jgi:hypothetical protein